MIDGVLGTRTPGGMAGPDGSTELWRYPTFCPVTKNNFHDTTEVK